MFCLTCFAGWFRYLLIYLVALLRLLLILTDGFDLFVLDYCLRLVVYCVGLIVLVLMGKMGLLFALVCWFCLCCFVAYLSRVYWFVGV